jgi:hypothetical protein
MTRILWILLCAATVWAESSQERGKRVVMEALAALYADSERHQMIPVAVTVLPID